MKPFTISCTFTMGILIAISAISMAKANTPEWQPLGFLVVGGFMMFSALICAAKE